jgi:hypothetical protein
MSATQFRPAYVSFDCYGAWINDCETVAGLDDVNTMLGS